MMDRISKLGVVTGIAVLLSVFIWAGIGRAEFPEKPIQVLVGWPVGSMNDSIDRVIAQSLQKILKQPIIIQNVPGGGGAVVLGRVKNEKPDGYTLFQTGTYMYAQTPHMRQVPFDPLKDFAYLAQHARFQHLIEDLPDSPWKNYDELIQYVRKNPKKVKYGSTGIGAAPHLMMEYLAMRENLQWIHVPYNSSSEITAALLGGHVDLAVTAFGLEIEHIKGGRMRALLALNKARIAVLKDVPTVLEKGYDFTIGGGACWTVPVNTPKDIQQKLERALLQSFKEPDVVQIISKWNMAYDVLDAASTTQQVADDYKALGGLVKKFNLGIYKK